MAKKNRHHRLPKSRGGSGHPENISLVDPERHFLWHALFLNMNAEEIVEEINRVWIDPQFQMKCVRRRRRK